MSIVKLDKVTVNIGVGSGGQPLDNARSLLQQLTQRMPVNTLSKTRNPTFKLRKGEPIGAKVTLRGKIAKEFLVKALEVKERKLPERSFCQGSVSFGVPEYIDFPGAKYDPNIGMLGFDVCVTLKKPGKRVSQRRVAPRRLPRKQQVSKGEAMSFMKNEFSVDVVAA